MSHPQASQDPTKQRTDMGRTQNLESEDSLLCFLAWHTAILSKQQFPSSLKWENILYFIGFSENILIYEDTLKTLNEMWLASWFFIFCCVYMCLLISVYLLLLWQRFILQLFIKGSPCARPSSLCDPAMFQWPGDRKLSRTFLQPLFLTEQLHTDHVPLLFRGVNLKIWKI